ncbi:oligosaccharide flippase family protein [Paenibacillus chitinolyticus]|uniref:oligosaccharide flippase family protein n=1 Tax=Paenibacillus chitinolyticus TaxID=79263 RepID=UPI003D074C57
MNNLTKPLSLKKNFSWSLTGNVFYTFAQFCMFTLIVKITNPESVGVFSLGLAVASPVFMFTNLNLRAIQATDRKDEYDFKDYMMTRLIMSTTAILIILGMSIAAQYPYNSLGVILAVGFNKYIESISDVAYGYMQKKERMDKISISQILKGCLSIFLFGAFLYFSKDLVIALIGLSMSWVFILFFYDLRTVSIQNGTYTRNYATLLKLVRLSIPLGLVMMINSLNTNIPRYFLEKVSGLQQLGYFSAMAYIFVAGGTIITAIGQSITPRLAEYYSSNQWEKYISLVKKTMVMSLLLGMAGVLVSVSIGKEILTLIYDADYANYSDVFVLLMLGAALSYMSSILGYSITAARSFNNQLYIGVVWILCTSLGSFIFIPLYGMYGASITLIIAYFIKFVQQALYMRILKKKLQEKKLLNAL